MPDLPNLHTGFVLGLSLLALGLFATERVRLESAALIVLLLLLLGFTLFPYSPTLGEPLDPAFFLAAFGNEALIAVCVLMVLGKGIETTQALRPVVSFVTNYWVGHERLMMLGVLLAAAVLSAFLNNTPIVIILLPALLAVAKRSGVTPSKILMPVGLVTIIGGMATTIGTSTNLLVVNLSESIAGVSFGMFDFAWYVVIAGSVGVVYLWLVAPLLMPARTKENLKDSEREYVATLYVEHESPLVDTTVATLLGRSRRTIVIDQIVHNKRSIRLPLPSVELHAGDEIHVRGTRDALKDAEHLLKAPLTRMAKVTAPNGDNDQMLAELLITQNSELDRSTLAKVSLRKRFGIAVIAWHRQASARNRRRTALQHIPLRAGDILLCEGHLADFERLTRETNLLLLNEATELPRTSRSKLALGIMAGVVGVAAFGLLPIVVSAFVGVGLMLATGCLRWRHVHDALSTQVIMIIVVSLALGSALMATDGDRYLASIFNYFLADASPFVAMATLMLLLAIITNVVSNNAAAVIGTPVAVQIAAQLGVEAEPLILAVLFGANLSFATPIGYQTNLLVLSAGGYRFSDFVRVGGPLTLILWACLSYLIGWQYDLL